MSKDKDVDLSSSYSRKIRKTEHSSSGVVSESFDSTVQLTLRRKKNWKKFNLNFLNKTCNQIQNSSCSLSSISPSKNLRVSK